MENNNDILDSYNPITGETLTIVEGLNRPQEEIDAMWIDTPEQTNQIDLFELQDDQQLIN